jgi:hypothetical protein
MCLIYDDEQREATEEELQARTAAYGAFTQDVIEQGLMVAGAPLQSTTTATTVRVRDGETLTTDGPFAETKEQLLGYYLLDCKDLDHAIEVAARIPTAGVGSIEVRPIIEMPADYPRP